MRLEVPSVGRTQARGTHRHSREVCAQALQLIHLFGRGWWNEGKGGLAMVSGGWACWYAALSTRLATHTTPEAASARTQEDSSRGLRVPMQEGAR